MDKLAEQIKKSMRISHNALDNILSEDIKAGTLDLKLSGVQPFTLNKNGKEKIREDALIHKAIELYCKWQEDFQGKGEKYEKAYRSLKDALALCGDYHEG